MKRITTLILIIATVLCLFASCNGVDKDDITNNPEVTDPATPDSSNDTEVPKEKTVIRIGGLKGPTSMGMVKLLEDNEKGLTKNKYDFTIAAAADELSPKLIKGELDMLACPANLASILYSKTEGEVEVLAINTLGVLYIVENGSTVSSVSDLKGKTVFATGKGTTPEYALRYILTKNGIDPDKDLTIEWKSEATEVVSALSKEKNSIGMLPQPFVTVAKTKIAELSVALDLTAEWDKADTESRLITGVLVARKDFIEKEPDAVAAFLQEYEASTEYINENPSECAIYVEKHGIVAAAVAEKAIPHCNITFISGAEMKTALKGYLTVLHGENPKAVGGSLPADNFYH